MAESHFITPQDLELVNETDAPPLNLKEVRANAERTAILQALNICDNNVSQAARLLGISRPTLYNLFTKHGLTVETTHD
jgi:two-component system NtrC family response regulator